MPGQTRRITLMKRTTVSLAVMAALVAGSATSVAADGRSFVTAGRCTIIGTQLKIDPANLEGHLPKGFEAALDPAGKATLQVEFFRCDPFTVDGEGGRPRIGSVITAHVKARDGSSDTWGYDLWHAQNRSDFHSAFTRLGGFAGHVQNASFRQVSLGAAEVLEASIPWDYSSYSFSLTTTSPPPAGPDFHGVHYQLGKHGLIRIDYPIRDFRLGGGVGTLHATAGSPLAEILGEEEVTFPAVIIDLEFEGYHEIIQLPSMSG